MTIEPGKGRVGITKLLTRLLFLVLFGFTAVPSPGLAQSRVPDLSQVSIEDLMNIEITSASRKEQRAADVAAAVFVITHDVNVDAAERSGLRLSSRLLGLAKVIRNGHGQ